IAFCAADDEVAPRTLSNSALFCAFVIDVSATLPLAVVTILAILREKLPPLLIPAMLRDRTNDSADMVANAALAALVAVVRFISGLELNRKRKGYFNMLMSVVTISDPVWKALELAE